MDSGPFQVAVATRNQRGPAASQEIGEDPHFEIKCRENSPLIISPRASSSNSVERTLSSRGAGRRPTLRVVTDAAEITEDEGFVPPERNYECDNYETCLGLAAALNWKSFTCSGCCGEVNQQLLWRAHHQVRNNPALSKLCSLPTLTES